MYAKTGVVSTLGGGTLLAVTGFNLLWVGLATFALLAAGFAILRCLPRKEA